MATQIQVRRDTGANWASANPVLAQGEWGLDTTAGQLKIGDGVTAWASLAYLRPGVPISRVLTATTTVGALTLTAVQLLGGIFVDQATQTAAATLTTDTAANLVAAVKGGNVGDSFPFRLVNDDQSTTGYALTLAGGSGVTLGTVLTNPAIPKGGYGDFLITLTDLTTPAVTVAFIGGASAALF